LTVYTKVLTPPSHGNAWAGVLYAGAVYETNQLKQAEHLLNVYLPLARDVGLPDHMILSHVMRSRTPSTLATSTPPFRR